MTNPSSVSEELWELFTSSPREHPKDRLLDVFNIMKPRLKAEGLREAVKIYGEWFNSERAKTAILARADALSPPQAPEPESVDDDLSPPPYTQLRINTEYARSRIMAHREPDAYLHTMHRENFNDPARTVSFKETHPWGVRGKDFDPSFSVTTEPLYRADALSPPPAPE